MPEYGSYPCCGGPPCMYGCPPATVPCPAGAKCTGGTDAESIICGVVCICEIDGEG
ncbi:MAG: hypothetical protein R3B70_39635 [Polyangiaceae bacterium]